MQLIVYGDFNCPYSYLASQRVDELARLGQAEVEWRAVEHDPALALTGTPSGLDPERWQRELAELALIADEDEQAPGVAPSVISNTGAAVAAYAEAVTDGVQDDLRRSLFSEIWVNRRHLSSPYGVPLTAGGYGRIRQWRDGWLSGAEGMVPALSLPDGMLTGVPALARLAELAGRAAAGARLPAAVGH